MEGKEKKQRKGKYDEVFRIDTGGMSFPEVVRKVANAKPEKAKRPRTKKSEESKDS